MNVPDADAPYPASRNTAARELRDLLLVHRAPAAGAGGDAPVDEHDVAVNGDLHADQRVAVAAAGEVDDPLGDAIRQTIGMPFAHGLGKPQTFVHDALLVGRRRLKHRQFVHPHGNLFQILPPSLRGERNTALHTRPADCRHVRGRGRARRSHP